MKNKTLYLIIFILAVVIFIANSSNKKVVETNQPVLKVSQVESGEVQAIAPSTEPMVFFKQAITLVKSAPKREELPLEVVKTKDIKVEQDYNSTDARVSSLTSGYSSSAETEEPASGITRTGKYPSKEAIKEMNSKGIVMY